jgi:hypothetical protein
MLYGETHLTIDCDQKAEATREIRGKSKDTETSSKIPEIERAMTLVILMPQDNLIFGSVLNHIT